MGIRFNEISNEAVAMIEQAYLNPAMDGGTTGADKYTHVHKGVDEPDFRARNALDSASLAELFAWEEEEFLRRTEGSPIRRIGHERWLRNIAVALGNAPSTPENLAALGARASYPSALVREHVAWALEEHARRAAA